MSAVAQGRTAVPGSKWWDREGLVSTGRPTADKDRTIFRKQFLGMWESCLFFMSLLIFEKCIFVFFLIVQFENPITKITC